MTRLLPTYLLLRAILYICSAQTRKFEIADRSHIDPAFPDY